jgi:putative transposase
MSDLYNDQFRIDSARLKNWDYSTEGLYYVTICTKNRECFFGEIANNIVFLTEIGKIAHEEWLKTSEIRPDMNLELGKFIVMPNHVHGIIKIGKNEYNFGTDARGRNTMHGISTTPKFGPQSKNLSSIMRGFKSAVTTAARLNQISFDWQSRFHDHIIRSYKEFINISEYIANNPSNWKDDEFNK